MDIVLHIWYSYIEDGKSIIEKIDIKNPLAPHVREDVSSVKFGDENMSFDVDILEPGKNANSRTPTSYMDVLYGIKEKNKTKFSFSF